MNDKNFRIYVDGVNPNNVTFELKIDNKWVDVSSILCVSKVEMVLTPDNINEMKLTVDPDCFLFENDCVTDLEFNKEFLELISIDNLIRIKDLVYEEIKKRDRGDLIDIPLPRDVISRLMLEKDSK